MKTFLTRSLVLMCAATSLQAATITEDFYYPSLTDGTALASNANGGSGWSGAWAGDANILYNSGTNLVSSNYALAQTPGSGSLAGSTSNYRAIYRNLSTAATGEVWFSYVFRKGGTGSGGLVFNATTSTTATNWNVLLDTAGGLNVTLNGVTTNVASVSTGTDYLVVGRMITGSSGSFSLWLNPDLNSVSSMSEFLALQTPLYSNSSVVNPDSISSLGAAAYRGTSSSSVFRFDALNLSDGNGNAAAAFAAVTGVPVPEPATLSFIVMGAGVVLAARRRKLVG